METSLLDPIRHQINCGDRQGARTALAELLEKEPDNADAWALLAILLADPTDQAQCYSEILRINPDDRHAAAWLKSLTAKMGAVRAPLQPMAREPQGRECPRCGEMIRASPLPGSPRAAIVCPYCGFPVPLADESDGEEAKRDEGEAGEAEIEWIPEGIDLEQLLHEIDRTGTTHDLQTRSHDPESLPQLTGRENLLDRLLGRFRDSALDEEAEELLTSPVEIASAAGTLSPELILRLAGGPLAAEERRDCPMCGAVVSRAMKRCPWCSAPLSKAEDL